MVSHWQQQLLFPSLSASPSLSLSPVPLPSSPPIPCAAQLHCNPWQRRGPEKPQWRPKTSKWLPAGECGQPAFPSPPLYPSLPSLSPSLPLCSLCKKMSVAFCGFVSGFRIAFCLRFASVTRHAHPWQPSCLLPHRLPSLRFCSICCHLLRRLHVLRCSIIKELTCRLRGFIAGDLSQRPPQPCDLYAPVPAPAPA